MFADVPDLRKPRGRRYDLPVVLTVAVAAVLAGAKSLLAIGEWVSEVDREALTQVGIGAEARLLTESTIRGTLAWLGADDLDARVGAWMATRVVQFGGRGVLSVDGKTLRGACLDGVRAHLLAVLDHEHRVVLGQRAVADKGSEILELKTVLEPMDPAGVVVTADALHCQRQTATWLASRGAHYVLTVKGNQPTVRNALKKLPWAQVPGHTYPDRQHGRRVTRTVKAVNVPDWVHWPGAAQVLHVRRTRILKGRKTTEVVYAISSVPMTQAQPQVLASWIQGH